MFTGLVESTGTLRAKTRRGPGFRLDIATSLSPLELGESISVNGVCLTVSAHSAQGFEADVSVETVEKTTLGGLVLGASVNLERSLTLGTRLGGHLVSGHVDGVAHVIATNAAGEATQLRIQFPTELGRYIAAKGSVALDGVSLTVNSVSDESFEIMLIPHTQNVTTLGALRVGSALNLEVDLLARYVARQLEFVASSSSGRDSRLRDVLIATGIAPELK
jgi:riboflavin synthase